MHIVLYAYTYSIETYLVYPDICALTILIPSLNMSDAQVSKVRTREDAAYRCYRRKSGEEALLEHKLKQKRCTASLEYFLKKDPRDIHKSHNQHLIKQHHRLSQPPRHCNNNGCDNKCLPFTNKCSRRILRWCLLCIHLFVPCICCYCRFVGVASNGKRSMSMDSKVL